MGHALLIVIVEPDTPSGRIEQRVGELMEPYDQDCDAYGRENIEEPCGCLDSTSTANPTCDECDGSGSIVVSYNPRETFDWYEPGGRWDGDIRLGLAPSPGWFEQAPNDIKRNMVLVQDVPPTFVPWAVLTPDGEWHGGGPHADKDEDAWAVEQEGILRGHPEHLAIGVDFHY